MKVRLYSHEDEQAVIALWHACGLVNPKNDPAKDIRRKLKAESGWILVGEEKGRIVASVMVGYEGHRGWLNYLAVAPGRRKEGLGRKMVDQAEARLRKIGCPKINLQVRTGNRAVIGFYEALGYRNDEVISLGKRLVDDSKPARKAKSMQK